MYYVTVTLADNFLNRINKDVLYSVKKNIQANITLPFCSCARFDPLGRPAGLSGVMRFRGRRCEGWWVCCSSKVAAAANLNCLLQHSGGIFVGPG